MNKYKITINQVVIVDADTKYLAINKAFKNKMFRDAWYRGIEVKEI